MGTEKIDGLRTRAHAGDVVAMRELAEQLHRKLVGSRREALDWWRRAAESGDAESMERLGWNETGTEAKHRWRVRHARTVRGPRPDLIPPEAVHTAVAAELGAPLAMYGYAEETDPISPAAERTGCLVLVGLGAVLAAGLAVAGTRLSGGSAVALFVGAGILGLLAVLGLIGSLTGNGAGPVRHRRGTCVFTDGLVHLPRTGEVQVFPWFRTRSTYTAVHHVRNGTYERTSCTLTLTRDDDASLVLHGDSRRGLDTTILAEDVAAAIVRVRLPVARAALARGDRLTFGDLTLDRTGITVGRDAISWADVEYVDVAKGYVRVNRRGGLLSWSRTPVGLIPDLPTLLNVAEDMRRR